MAKKEQKLMTVSISPELHKQLKLYATEKGFRIQEAAEEAITKYLGMVG